MICPSSLTVGTLLTRVAQAAGIAEADPSGDLKGMDAAVKLVALAVSFKLGVPDGAGALPGPDRSG